MKVIDVTESGDITTITYSDGTVEQIDSSTGEIMLTGTEGDDNLHGTSAD